MASGIANGKGETLLGGGAVIIDAGNDGGHGCGGHVGWRNYKGGLIALGCGMEKGEKGE